MTEEFQMIDRVIISGDLKMLLPNSYNRSRWFKQIKRTVYFYVTTRFNPNKQSTAMYNSHVENVKVKKTFAGTDQTTSSRVKLRYFDWL